MRQSRSRRDIADSVDAFHIGPAELVGHNLASFHLHAQGFKPQALQIGHNADRRKHDIAFLHFFAFLGLDIDLAFVACRIHFFHRGVRHHLHAVLAETPVQVGR